MLTSSRPSLRGGGVDAHLEHVDPRLEAAQGLLDLALDAAQQRRADGPEHQIVDAAAEVRAHHPLALAGFEDDPDRLLDILLIGGG